MMQIGCRIYVIEAVILKKNLLHYSENQTKFIRGNAKQISQRYKQVPNNEQSTYQDDNTRL